MAIFGTLPETNSSHLKMDGWKTNIVSFWGPACFQGHLLLVSGRVSIRSISEGNPHAIPGFFVSGCNVSTRAPHAIPGGGPVG